MNVQDNRSALVEGSQIGVYEVRELIGRDLLSLTYKAWNHHLNTPVLLREHFPFGLVTRCTDGIRLEALSDTDRERYAKGLSEFLYEAEKLADIDHEAVPKVLNALEFNDTGYQITSFERGRSLSALLESAYSFKEDQLRIIFEALLAGLKAVHAHGLVHGMICPENIVLRGQGDPILINFSAGLLQFARHEGELFGQLREGYASAEQYRPDHCPAPADDLYALAATLYRCITGRAPLSASDRLKLLEKGDTDPMAQLISSQGSEAPAPWIKAVAWMLRPEAKDRPRGVSQIETFLAEIARQPKPDQQSSGVGLFRAARIGMTRTGMRTVMAVALVLIVAAGIWSVRNARIPDFIGGRDPGTGTDGGKTPKVGAPVSIDRSQTEASAEKSESATAGGSEQLPEGTGSSAGESEYSSVGSGEAVGIELNTAGSELLSSSKNESSIPETSHAEPKAPSDAVESDQLAPAITGHLAAAKQNLAALNLTTPKQDNAYSNYQAVLGLDPANQEARSGIKRILNRYVRLIESALQSGRLRNAEVYLARAESIAADSPALDSVRSKLEKAKRALSNRR